jgi:hypothetical protein
MSNTKSRLDNESASLDGRNRSGTNTHSPPLMQMPRHILASVGQCSIDCICLKGSTCHFDLGRIEVKVWLEHDDLVSWIDECHDRQQQCLGSSNCCQNLLIGIDFATKQRREDTNDQTHCVLASNTCTHTCSYTCIPGQGVHKTRSTLRTVHVQVQPHDKSVSLVRGPNTQHLCANITTVYIDCGHLQWQCIRLV